MQIINRNKLKGAIAESGIKKQDLAVRLGISRQELSYKLSGQHSFNENQMVVLEGLFGREIFNLS